MTVDEKQLRLTLITFSKVRARWRIGLHNRYEDHSGGPVDCRPQPPQAHLIAACSVPCRGSRTTKFESFRPFCTRGIPSD